MLELLNIMHTSSLKNFKYLFILGSLTLSQGDWLDDSGRNELIDYLRDTSIPSVITNNVPVNMVEGGGSYLPFSFTGTTGTSASYPGITFTNASNTSTGASGHAGTVAGYYFSPNGSFVTGISEVFCYGATHFLDDYMDGLEYFTAGQVIGGQVIPEDGYYYYSSGQQVLPMNQRVSSHAYVGGATGSLLAKFDYLGSTGNTVMVVGLNNGSGTTVPVGWGSSYNAITVGSTSNGHSMGDTTDDLASSGITAGRTKPEIVSNGSATSWSTGQVSSGATHIYGYANYSGFTDITANTEVQRAILLAGATKEEFPSWQNASSDPTGTETRPLDPSYGAGEMNVFHSHRIIEGGTPTGTVIGNYGWDYDDLGRNASRTYTFTIPNEVSSASLSAMLCWNRPVTETNAGGTYSYNYGTLRNLNLELSGGTLTAPLESNGSLDNLEHIYATALGPGSYSLTVSQSGGSNFSPQAYGLAWRMNIAPVVEIPTTCPSITGVEVENLIPGHSYEVWESSDLSNWSYVENFTPTSSTYSWNSPNLPNAETEHFYRLRYWK